MTAANRKIVTDWIMMKVPQYACVFCGNQTWSVGEVVMPPLATDLRSGQPLVVVQCADCGRVDLFDAVSVGLRPPFA